MTTLLAAALAAMAYAFALSEGNFSVLVASQALVLAVPFASVFTHRFHIRVADLLLWAVFSGMLLLTILVNNHLYRPDDVLLAVIHAGGVIGMVFVAQWAASNTDTTEVIRRFAILIAPLVALGVVLSLKDGFSLLRQSPLEIHPNWWGEVAFALSVSAFAIRSMKWRIALIALSVVLLLLVQSRGALLATGAVVGVNLFFAFRVTPFKVFTASLVAVIASMTLLMEPEWAEPIEVVSSTVLLLDDPERGLGTGLTGRLEGFSAAVNVAMEHPFFGAGFDTLPEVHNGFLRIAGEGGFPFLILLVSMIGVAITRAYRSSDGLALGILIGYALLTMTYPRMLNMNVASALFYLCLFRR